MMENHFPGLLGLGNALLLAGFAGSTGLLRRRNASLRRQLALASQAPAGAPPDPAGGPWNDGIGVVAHDLRNPLHGILLAAELLEEGTPGCDVPRIARMIQSECQAMDQLIGRFLDLAAIEAGTSQGDPSLCALGELTRQIAERHALRAQQKGIQLVLELSPEAAPVFLDEHFAKEILDNLLSNALKFSKPGTTVTLGLDNHQDRVRCSVTDQGPGLTLQDQALLFKRFTKLSASPTGGERSLGLGLSIVKHMVDTMGGSIWVTSAPGAGAAFHVEFPAALTKEV